MTLVLPTVARLRRPAPGSTLWLLLQEFRLFKRGTGMKRWPLLIGILVALLFGHGIGALFGLMWDRMPPEMASAKLVILSALCPLAFFIMLGPAIMQMVNALFIRGDFDLLLSAPIRPQAILPVRAGAVALAALMGWLALISGIADTGLYLGHSSWLAAYPVIACLALLATTAALLITLALVRWVGVKRTRGIAQFLAVITGMAGAIAGQAPQLLRLGDHAQPLGVLKHTMGLLPAADSPLLLAGRFMQGDPVLLLPVLVLAPLLFWISTRRLAPYFITAAVMAGNAPTTRHRTQAPAKTRFSGSRALVLIRHEGRVLRRNPHLPNYLAQQFSSILPLFIILVINGNRGSWDWTSFAVVPVVAYLTGALTKLTRGEEMADLALSAPIPRDFVQYAKLTTAILPGLVLLILASGIVAVCDSAWTALVLLLCGGGGMITAVLCSLWVQPGMASVLVAQRRFGKNKQTGGMISRQLGENLLALGWGATAVMGVMHNPYGLLVAVGLLGITMILKTPL